MAVRLHLGTQVFEVPPGDATDVGEYVNQLLADLAAGEPFTRTLKAGDATITVFLNPARLPFLALDPSGTWIGFHSG